MRRRQLPEPELGCVRRRGGRARRETFATGPESARSPSWGRGRRVVPVGVYAAHMKWGIVFSSTSCPDPDSAAALAENAEEAGFESLWAPEHIVIPSEYEPT